MLYDVFGIVVVWPVCNECIVAERWVVGENSLHELLAVCQGYLRTKFKGCSARETFSNLTLNGRSKKCALSTENWSYIGKGDR